MSQQITPRVPRPPSRTMLPLLRRSRGQSGFLPLLMDPPLTPFDCRQHLPWSAYLLARRFRALTIPALVRDYNDDLVKDLFPYTESPHSLFPLLGHGTCQRVVFSVCSIYFFTMIFLTGLRQIEGSHRFLHPGGLQVMQQQSSTVHEIANSCLALAIMN